MRLIRLFILMAFIFFACASAAFSYDNGVQDAKAIRGSRIVGMVYDAKKHFGVKNCEITLGGQKAVSDENGYFEMPEILCGSYLITAVCAPYKRHIDIIRIDAALEAVKIYLFMPGVKEKEAEAAAREYDRKLAAIMKRNVNEISINDDEKPAKKNGYYSKYGRKQSSQEGAGGRKYSEKSKDEISKSPRITAEKGFGILLGRVFESSGGEIEANARVIIATQAVETERSQPFTINNVPVGSYPVTIKCDGYVVKKYDKLKISPGKNHCEFYISRISK